MGICIRKLKAALGFLRAKTKNLGLGSDQIVVSVMSAGAYQSFLLIVSSMDKKLNGKIGE